MSQSNPVTEGPDQWRGTSAADRAGARRRQLLDTGHELLGTVGLAGTSVRQVCKCAGLSHRYFYESFEDLDALLAAVFDQIVAEAGASVIAAVAAAPESAEARSRVAAEAGIRYLTDDPRRIRI